MSFAFTNPMVNYFFFSYKANLNIDGSGAVVAAPDQNTPGKFYLTEVSYIILHLTLIQIGRIIFCNVYFDPGGSYYYHWMRDAGLSIKAWLDINDNDYDKSKDVLNAYVKWVNVVQHKPDPNDIDVRIGKKYYVHIPYTHHY